MALVNCVECGKEVSDKAEQCPHCGRKDPNWKGISFKKRPIQAIYIWIVYLAVMGGLGYIIKLYLDGFR